MDMPTSTGYASGCRSSSTQDAIHRQTQLWWWVVICFAHWGIVFLHVLGCCWVWVGG